ncbi:glutaminyl-tRNA synthase (glutamine-hydrolyzing) subunit B [Candidatus Kaiserbacteria bacterium RIFCSPHIGHO2_02_FULL_49_16]|uniref:Aspartyl/glutamyl-tRNA(Asn/Gln) amidotransferase subunit B n=1 Tax=Candidatus Kaiserbacteria bacterium RIFCSPHIGHO2_02_FULL_49_16 TaxID=1798490 RepID=A0A1F6DE35_9BACT|nr:MAG: glutaminyl-tRNA synthase (glutamine-hydrolyzing) subunit B [Candidatus Kaiserbacteria bacterium RIFCSPHIGHO2_02_FULL_49_16]
MSNYIATIGLEIHAELKTKTKMFCNSKNDADEARLNFNVCPVCLAHPGTLPVINKEAVRHVLRVGRALQGKLADYTEFDRKNYFYPDLPKGYQISQYEFPLVSGGSLNGVQITRIHLEEDTASSIHDDKNGATEINYNRAGIPLMELVTEPVIRSAEEAGKFARELQLLLRYLDASEANMEKGEMRVEANVSVRKTETFASADTRKLNADNAEEILPRDSAYSLRDSAVPLGTKVEIKNLNSFRIMERAVAYEIKRQQDLLELGEKVAQETRGWDEKAGKTFPQRVKEGSADYRYFPDPDLPSLRLSLAPDFADEAIEKTMPELPGERRKRYLKLGIKSEDAELYLRDGRLGNFFESVTESYKAKSRELVLSSNYIANDLVKLIRDMQERDSETQAEIPISPEHFQKIIRMISSNRISSRTAKDLLLLSVNQGEDPEEIALKKGLLQTDSRNIESVVAEIIQKNPKVIADYKVGKQASLEYLIGQCMKTLRGAADPVLIRKLLLKELA